MDFHNPILVKLINQYNQVTNQFLFVGTPPLQVLKTLKETVATYNKSPDTFKSPTKAVNTLSDYYGKNYLIKLGFTSTIVGADDMDISNVEDLIGDILDVRPAEDIATVDSDIEAPPEPKKESKSKKPIPEVEPLPLTMPEVKPLQLAPITLIEDIQLYPEDRIFDLKLKIYCTTGINIYSQHLFFYYRESPIPLWYKIYIDNPILINIVKAFNDIAITGTILGLPIDHNTLQSKDLLKIIAQDTTKTIADIYHLDASPTLYLCDLGQLLTHDIRVQLAELLKTDKVQIELLYYSFIIKFFPMISPAVFETMITNEKDMKNVYPDLVPTLSRLRDQFTRERTILDRKYELLESGDPKFAKYNPDLKSRPDSLITVAVKTASLNVEPVAIDLLGKIQLDIGQLFKLFGTSDAVPFIKCNLLIGKQSRIFTKLHNTGNISKIYDSIKHKLKLPYPGMIVFVIKFATTGGAEDSYCTLTIYWNGKYNVVVSWEDESAVTLGTLYESIVAIANPHISRINDFGRQCFNSISKLQHINSVTAKFSDLVTAATWLKNLTDREFGVLEKALQEDLGAGCFKRAVDAGEILPNSFGFNAYKGMTDTNPERIDEFSANYYAFLTDARIKQKWVAQVDSGRLIIVTRRTFDVQFTMSGLTESEFKYFYNYIICRLYDISTRFKTEKRANTKLTPILEKNRLKLLKERDPKLYKFKKFGSNVVYSRICQKENQPEIYYPNEYEILPSERKKRAVKYWNFTTGTPMYYLCPNPTYPHLSFRVGIHPKNYCLPCCKKTLVYEYDLTTSANDETKKSNIYNACMQAHEYREEDTALAPSRYIMTYGKPLDVGRISYLPGSLDKYLLYNLTEKEDIPQSTTVVIDLDGKFAKFDIETLVRISRNNKIREIPIEDLRPELNTKLPAVLTLSKSPTEQISSDAKPSTVTLGELLADPNLDPKNYNMITNAVSYPIIVYKYPDGRYQLIDGIYRLGKLWGAQPTVKVRNVTRRQLTRSLVKRQAPSHKKIITDNMKKPGYYIYGVPQSTVNHEDIGCLYVISSSLRISIEDFMTRVTRYLSDHPDTFSLLLQGNVARHFSDVKDLINSLNLLISEDVATVDTAHIAFTSWNELFIDLTKRVYNKYCIIFDDKSTDATGTSSKISQDDIRLVLPDHIQESGELIPEDNVAREFIIILRRRRKSKNIFGYDHYYYPIFVFIPQEFFKSFDIRKRVFVKGDDIIDLIKSLIDQTFTDEAATLHEISFRTIEKFCAGGKRYTLRSAFATNDKLFYAIDLGPVVVPIAYSNPILSQQLKTQSAPMMRSKLKQTHMGMLQFIKDYNAFIVAESTRAGLIRVIPEEDPSYTPAERSVIPIYPFIKVEKFLEFAKSIIGFEANGLYYYFKPTTYKIVYAAYNPSRGYCAIKGDKDVRHSQIAIRSRSNNPIPICSNALA